MKGKQNPYDCWCLFDPMGWVMPTRGVISGFSGQNQQSGSALMETLAAVPTFPYAPLQVPHAFTSYKDSIAPFSSPPSNIRCSSSPSASSSLLSPPLPTAKPYLVFRTRCFAPSSTNGLYHRPQTHPQVLQSQELDLFHLLLRQHPPFLFARSLRPILRLSFDHVPHARIHRLQPLPDRRDPKHFGDAQTWLPRTHLPRRASCSRAIQDGGRRPFHACFGL